MNPIGCKFCRRPLTAKSGCPKCDPFRPHLLVLDAVEERPSLSTVTNEAVKALRLQLQFYERSLARVSTSREDAEDLRARQRSVAGAMSKLLDAARKIAGDGVSAVEAMSFQERAELFVTWFCSLPAVYRESLLQRLQSEETQIPPETTVQ